MRGAVRVNRRMETNLPAVFAAGDCVQTWHALLEQPLYLPLGTTAHKQGRVAGENAAGGDSEFSGSLGTQVVKVFELAAARTGLSEADATAAGLSAVSADTIVADHKPYYPGATELHIRITGDADTDRLLGGQIVGHWQAEVAKRIDILATAIHQGLRVADLAGLDLSYTPPVSAPWDPVQVAVDTWVKERRSAAAVLARGCR
jgi:NADPH-dependent 2,4-dienoyl-CoA reductase/sulfur reductase-like enzyme